MPGQPFYFALEFSSDGVSPALLGDLASQVLAYVGCSCDDVPELCAALARAAGASAAAPRPGDVRFSVQGGALDIRVSSSGGRIFQTSHPIPDRS